MPDLSKAQLSLLESMGYGWTLMRDQDTGEWSALHRQGYGQRVRRATADVVVKNDFVAIDYVDKGRDVFKLTSKGIAATQTAEPHNAR